MSFTLSDREGPIWESRGREFKSRRPDQPMDAIQPSRTGIQPTFLPPSITPANCAERESDRSIVEPIVHVHSLVLNGVLASVCWHTRASNDQNGG
jgi:hypothetical protein